MLWTISNGLSFLRLLLSLPLAYALYTFDTYLTIGIGVIAYITDLLDGFLARKLNQVSEWGKIIDPIADKVFVATAVIVMTLQQRIPLWFVCVVVGRDLLIVTIGAIYSKKHNFVLPSLFAGKAAVVAIGFALIIHVIGLPAFEPYTLWWACLLMAISLYVYGNRLYKHIVK